MNILRVMTKHVGYYVLMMILVSFFAAASVRGLLITLCGAALSVSMFAAIAQLLLEGNVGATAHKISTWCLRSTAIVTAIVVIGGFGIENIIKVFSRG